LLSVLRAHANPANVAGMARYGIHSKGTLGVPVPVLRKLAKEAGRSHELAAELWASGIHEARILATLIDDPARVTERQMDRWVSGLDSWDVCDQACQNLFRYTPWAFAKAAKWARARREFVRRAGFSLMAGLAVKARTASDAQFEAFLPLIAEASVDDRNMVKKAVNWALRQIGKRKFQPVREGHRHRRGDWQAGFPRGALGGRRRPTRTAPHSEPGPEGTPLGSADGGRMCRPAGAVFPLGHSHPRIRGSLDTASFGLQWNECGSVCVFRFLVLAAGSALAADSLRGKLVLGDGKPPVVENGGT